MNIKTSLLAAGAAACALFAVGAVNAQVDVAISGGSGSRLQLRLLNEVTFTNVTSDVANYGFVLIGAAQGNTATDIARHSGTVAWNGTGNNAGFGNMGSQAAGDITLNDMYVDWSNGGNHPRTSSTMTLRPGTRSSRTPLDTEAVVRLGSYQIRIVDSHSRRFISDSGVQATPPTVDVIISGGNGTPLTIDLPRDVTFNNVISGRAEYGFALIDAAKGNTNTNPTDNRSHSGTMAWNGTGDNSGGGIMGIQNIASRSFTNEDIIATWNVFGGNSNHPQTGGRMTLSAGSRRTTGAADIDSQVITGAGSYQMLMLDGSTFTFISSPGVQAPPPLVEVNISGGSGTPLSIELLSKVTFTNIPTDTSGSYGLALIGAAKGNMTIGAATVHTGTMAWNDATNTGTGNLRVDNFGSLTVEDIFAYWSSASAPTIASTMTLSAGTRMTTGPIAAEATTGTGRYEMRMIRSGGNFIGDSGVQVAAGPTKITSVDFNSTTKMVTLRWLDTGGSYSIQASDDLEWGTPTTIEINGETEVGDDLQLIFSDPGITDSTQTRFWRVVTE